MKLGKLQKFWIEQLKKHPEKQTKKMLGEGTSDNYKACCLGELHLCAFRLEKKKLPFIDNQIYDGQKYGGTLASSYKKYGLLSPQGTFKKDYDYHKDSESLAHLNDKGVSWTEIADIIERNPENVFNKSV
jgi:hypothetical protein